MPKYTTECVFQQKWTENPQFKDWIRAHKCPTFAFCRLCNVDINIGSMGASALTSHAASKKHQLATKPGQPSVQRFFGVQHSRTDNKAGCSNTSMKNTESSTFKATSGQAEVLWALYSVEKHNSLRSTSDCGSIFKLMFPNDQAAQHFSLGKDKLSYMVDYGLAPYFRNELSKTLGTSVFSVSFDESLNKITQSSQMDIHIRFWDEASDQVITRYWTSEFLLKAKAENLLKHFKEGTTGLNCTNMIQVQTDGPNVMLKFHRMLEEEISLNADMPCLVSIGTCVLHIVHRSFETGHDAAGWRVNSILTALYYLFKDSPSRRADFASLTGESPLFLKFCAHRWLENVSVCQYAIDHWPLLVEYVKSFQSKSASKKPQVNSFHVLESAVKCDLTVARMHFFLSVAKAFEPFLTMFQSEFPMIPFLSEHLTTLLRSLLLRFMKKEVVLKTTDALSISKVDVTTKTSWSKTVEVGFGASEALQSLFLSGLPKEKSEEFRAECQNFWWRPLQRSWISVL